MQVFQLQNAYYFNTYKKSFTLFIYSFIQKNHILYLQSELLP